MKRFYFLSLGLGFALIINVCAGGDGRIGEPSATTAQTTVSGTVQATNEQVVLWSGYASLYDDLTTLQDGTSVRPGRLSTEDLGGSWPGPRW
jgi:hypothetical protein